MTDTIIYRYGCTRVAWDWTLCDDCSSRIGVHGTCLGCGGLANEQWKTDVLPDDRYCSESCAVQAALLALDE